MLLILTLVLTAGTIGGTVVGDHVLAVRRPTAHGLFLYLAMTAVLLAYVLAEVRGLLI